MKNICIHIQNNPEHWTLNPSDDFPILPIPGSIMKSLSKNNYFSLFINKGENYKKPKNILKIYKSFQNMISEVDFFITTGTEYLKFFLNDYSFKLKENICSKTIPIIYQAPKKYHEFNYLKNKIIASLSRGQIYTSISQFRQSKDLKIGNPIFLPVGIDVSFYKKRRHSELLDWLPIKDYIIMHGDEGRDNLELLKLADLLNLSIVRISQYPEKDIYKKSIFELASNFKNIPYIYHLQKVGFNDYISFLKNAKIYAGMINSLSQPAGWTSLCEANVLKLPSIVKKGITTTDYKKIIKKEDSSKYFLEVNDLCNDEKKIIKFITKKRSQENVLDEFPEFDLSKTSEIFKNNFLKNL